jgi:GNAT superfamily N-acetyltransferase
MPLRIESFTAGGPRMGDFAAVRSGIVYPAPDDELSAGAECLVAYDAGRPIARLAVQVAPELHGALGPSGLVGWYEALDGDAGTALLVRATEVLAERGAAHVLGPMNGSTWKRYRLALPPEPGEPAPTPFLTEPVNPPAYPAHFLAAGFTVAAEYESRAALRPADAPAESAGPPAGGDAPLPDGVGIAPLNPARFDDALRDIFDLSAAAFADNLYYTPIGFGEFAAAYQKIRPLLDPELVRLARAADGKLLAFVFAFPDPFDRVPDAPGAASPAGAAEPRGPHVILKTLATAPEARGMGLGRRLSEDVHRIAFARRAPSVVHALMQVDNSSTRISERLRGEPFRRYALYGWTP